MFWSCHIPDNKPETNHRDEDQEPTGLQGGDEVEEDGEGRAGEMYEEEQEVEEETSEEEEEEEVKVEWPTGVPQASDKDLAKLSHTEGVGISCLL